MADGTYVKTNPHAPAGFFEVEAAGLRWLRVPGGVAVVEPLEVSPGRLVLPRLRTVSPDQDSAERFGQTLAVTHDAGADWFGMPPKRLGRRRIHRYGADAARTRAGPVVGRVLRGVPDTAFRPDRA